MPLEKGSSKATILANIKELISSGYGAKQAAAIAYKNAGKDASCFGMDDSWITVHPHSGTGSPVLLGEGGEIKGGMGGKFSGKHISEAKGSGKQQSKSAAKAKKPHAEKKSVGMSVKNEKEFARAAESMYKSQKLSDWQADPYSPEALAARTYFGNEQSFHINNGLRHGKMKDKKTKEAADRFSKSFEKSSVELPEGTSTYRAVSGKFADQIKSMKPGDSFVDKGYFSTAATEKATKNFGNVLMKVKTKGAQKAMLYKDETEVLFAPGRKITVGKSKIVNGRHVVEVEVE